MAEKIDVSNIFPYSKMEKRTVDGVEYVFCPNTYVKTEVDENGLPTYWFSENKLDENYHLHPCFITNGEANPTGVLWSSKVFNAPASGGPHYTALVKKAAAYNAAPYNIYDHHFIARLILYECGDADCQNKLGGTENAKAAVNWRGIENVWGRLYEYFWIYGLKNHKGTVVILSNKMDDSMIETGVGVDSGGRWIREVMTAKGSNFDLGDVFLRKTGTTEENEGSFGDAQGMSSSTKFDSYFVSCLYVGVTSDPTHTFAGPFYMARSDGTSSSYKGFRLRRAI